MTTNVRLFPIRVLSICTLERLVVPQTIDPIQGLQDHLFCSYMKKNQSNQVVKYSADNIMMNAKELTLGVEDQV